MEILDKHFRKLSSDKKQFLFLLLFAYLLVAFLGFRLGHFNLVEGFLIFVIGVLYAEMLKLQYRIEKLERKR